MGNKVVKLSITTEELLNKKFKGAVRGYDAFEVDLYLDKILADYKRVEDNILISQKDYEELINRIDELNKQIEQLQVSNSSMKERIGNISENKNANWGNIDLLKRIDKLERALWKLGQNPTKIQ